ncbi:MAG: hypothetical protein M1816_007624 [Peltula sp. TS41687]|nr:MAG: hypothetical protein M1816_007624 [Peltula sp. TS41687]
MAEGYQSLQVSPATQPTSTGEVKLSAPPMTDIWRSPPAHDYLHAPIIYKSMKASAFRKARVTFSAKWTELYDQAGLVLVRPGTEPKKWVKAGTELEEGKPQISVVAADRWSDWSLQPQTSESLTIEFERKANGDKLESSLWIYAVEANERRPIRKITWMFEEDQEIWIGVYAARPAHGVSDALEVNFEGLTIDSV